MMAWVWSPGFILLLVVGWWLGSASALTYAQRHELCMQHVICRDRYLQSTSQRAGILSLSRFQRESESLEANMKLLALASPVTASVNVTPGEAQWAIYEMLLNKILFDESLCPPNSYWVWSDVAQQGECKCYIDRDCRTMTTTICHDTVDHVVMFLVVIFIILVVVDIIVRIVTDRYTK